MNPVQSVVESRTWTDSGLRVASRAADHGLLWFAVGTAAFAVGGRTRRAGVRGVLALAGASALTNAVLKPVFPRRRPPPEHVAPGRRPRRTPTSSSFPSGHAASAAAFVTGVALESPAAAALLAPVGAAVAYSRVHIGVHWPTDVLAGAAIGAAVAVGTRRWWAVRADEPATLGGVVSAPALPDGSGLLILVNPGSGDADEDPSDRLRRLFPAATLLRADPDGDVGAQLEAAVERSAPRALGVCGGDGTVVTAVGVALCHDLALAVFPGGTLNHFARDVGVEDLESTRDAVTAGTAVRVDVGEVRRDGNPATIFVNTASLGGYPDAVRLRERWEPRLGKWPAAAAAMGRVLARARPIAAEVDGTPTSIWMLFVGNGRYAPSDQVPLSRPDLNEGTLDVRYLRADRRHSRARLLWATLTGTLSASPTYAHTDATAVTVRLRSEPVSLATDGEVIGRGREFRFTSRPAALRLYRRRA
ncbi:bifunctional phosphatase PAP2/diacylglycerol kinase family protein [Rhodococcus kronopolitis]|uniref:Bifunctional phosphatase PAP2/diacylglycerol kinase family protein n=1 Tax=Rhodococcus kronopolitis TaxID=1460226 RepID=A0ABV9FSC3_9NOCA